MEFYTYVNIFETKGLEYLLLMSFLVMFIVLLRYLATGPQRKRPQTSTNAATRANRPG